MAKPGTLRAQIEASLQAEREHRYVGVADGLYSFEDLAPFRPAHLHPDGSVPVLVPPATDGGNPAPRGPGAEPPVEPPAEPPLRRMAPLTYRRLADRQIWALLGRPRGLVAAGGAVCGLLLGRESFSDIDLFLVGLSEAEAVAAVRDFPRTLHSRLLPSQALRVYRTAWCVTALIYARATSVRAAKVQLILRRYSTVSEVLHGFDLGASKVADDGERLYFSAEGRLAFERGVNVVHPDVRRASYEARLLKYWRRGFGIALLDFAWMASGAACGRLRLPYMELRNVEFAQATATLRAKWANLECNGPAPRATVRGEAPGRMPIRHRVAPAPRRPGDDEDAGFRYEAGECLLLYDRDAPTLAFDNLRAARRGCLEALCAAAPYAPGLDVTELQPCPEAAAKAVRGELRARGSCSWSMRRAFGDCADLVWQAAVLDRDLKWPEGRLESIIRAVAAPYLHALRIPFALPPVEAGTAFALSARDGQVTPEVWYGRHYAGTRGWQSRLEGLLAALLLPVLAPTVAEYAGRVLPAVRCPACGCADGSVCALAGPPEDGPPAEAWCLACGAELAAPPLPEHTPECRFVAVGPSPG